MIADWEILLEGEIYLHDDFLPQVMIDDLTKMQPLGFKKINNQNTPPVMYDTRFDYDLLNDRSFRNRAERYEIYSRMGKLAKDVYGLSMPTGDLHHMHYFYKRHDPFAPVAFDIHAEDPRKYGPFVFMLYLSDETDGAIEFPSLEDSQDDWSDGFQSMVDSFGVRFSQSTIRILPKKNRCLIVTCGIAHRVRKCSGYRPNISGWPFFDEQIL